MTNKRRPEISALNVLFCLIVIFIHIISYPVSSFKPNTLKYSMAMLPWRLSSFVVQGFILLSGVKLFLNGKDSKPFSKYLKSRFLGVVLPYAAAFLIYYIGFMIQYKYPLDILFISKNFFLGSLACHFYFIVILLQFDLLFPVWKRLINRCSPLLVIPFVLLISQLLGNNLPLMINTVFPNVHFIYNDRLFTTYLSFWVIGCYIGKNYDFFCSLLKNNFKVISAFFTFALVMVILFSYLTFNGIAYIPYLNQIHNLYALSVCIFLYALALKIPADVLKKPILTLLDGVSFYIYLYHILILLMTDKILFHFGIQAQGIAFIIRVLSVYGITPLICIGYKKLKKVLKAVCSKKQPTTFNA